MIRGLEAKREVSQERWLKEGGDKYAAMITCFQEQRV